MENLSIELNFEGVNAAGGLGSLPAGLHAASIAEFKHFPDTNRLYAYMVTNGIRHRESFGLDNPNSLPFVKAFLLSAGVPEDKVAGKNKVPFHKLCGRDVFFQYTPADTDDSGNRIDGSYARYVFYQQGQWEQMVAYSNNAPSNSDVVVEEPTSNGASSTAPVEAVGAADDDGDDFDFLLNDSDE